MVELFTEEVPPLRSESYLDSLSGFASGVGVGVGVSVGIGVPVGATLGVGVASGFWVSSLISPILFKVADSKVRVLSYQLWVLWENAATASPLSRDVTGIS